MIKVLYITNLPAPYKIKFFSLLSQKVELTVAYERKKAINRDEKWISDMQEKSFKEIYLNGLKVGNDTSCSMETIKLVGNHKFDTVVMNGISSPTAIVTITYMRIKKIKYGIMCDGMLPNKGNLIKNYLKHFLISGASYWLSSNEITTEVLKSYGAKMENIYEYPFSSVSEKEIMTEKYDKEEYKAKIGCAGKKVILYVGQFIYRKGLDVLIKAYEQLNSKNNHLIILGGKFRQLSVEVKDNITVLDFMLSEELEAYYRAADVFVLPTREDIWGLVINEALSRGIPVVTTERCGAGIAMIDEGHNGYIVPVDDAEALADKLDLALGNSEKMRSASVRSAKRYTIENMVMKTYSILQRIVN